MIFWENYGTIWEVIEDRGKYARVKFSTSRKDMDVEGKYHTSYWFANFIGKAYDKVKDIEAGTRVQLKGTLDNEPFIDSTGERAYRKTPAMAVYDFTVNTEDAASNRSMDMPPKQVKTSNITKEELPF